MYTHTHTNVCNCALCDNEKFTVCFTKFYDCETEELFLFFRPYNAGKSKRIYVVASIGIHQLLMAYEQKNNIYNNDNNNNNVVLQPFHVAP